MNKIKKLFIYSINIPLYLLAKIIQKNKNIWIFGAWFGEKYGDNSKYLFEYVNKNYPEIRAVWLSDNSETVNKLKGKNFEIYNRYSLKAILIGMKAKYSIFVQSNKTDCMLFLNNENTKLIQLWHGIPLKKIGLDDTLIIQNKYLNIKQILFPFLIEKYNLIIASGEEDKNKFTTSFKSENIEILGYPRNDNLFKNNNLNSFTVTYLPTFRDSIGDKIDLFTNYNFGVEDWNKKLLAFKITFNIKMHPVNKPKDEIIIKFKECKNIHFLDEVDVAEILPNTDILITDYSSVYFDFLLTDRPIIFAPFDYEKYITKDRELYYDYDEVTPGPKCKNWNEVMKWIKKFKENPNLYSKERKDIRDRFHKYQDGKSCERVYQEIQRLVNE